MISVRRCPPKKVQYAKKPLRYLEHEPTLKGNQATSPES